MEKDKEKVIIIGAGPAGLAAGYKLLKEKKEKYEVIILEAGNEIGGLSKTIKHIGKNGQHRYNNMDHSILTGFVAADKIINNDKDKTSLWNINTEKEYHEAKQ